MNRLYEWWSASHPRSKSLSFGETRQRLCECTRTHSEERTQRPTVHIWRIDADDEQRRQRVDGSHRQFFDLFEKAFAPI